MLFRNYSADVNLFKTFTDSFLSVAVCLLNDTDMFHKYFVGNLAITNPSLF